MSAFLLKLGRWCASHSRRVLIAWLLLLAALGAGAHSVGMQLSNSFDISATESITGISILRERLPQASGVSEPVLISARHGNISSYQPAIEKFVRDTSKISGISMATDPFAERTRTISQDGKHALVQVQTDSTVAAYSANAGGKASVVKAQLAQYAQQLEAEHPQLSVLLGGNIGQTAGVELSITEAIGVLVAALVLFATFGSLLAAGTPIISAVVGVGVGMLGILVAANFTTINAITPVLAVMIGLAVGIDYALFIMSRAREYLMHGISPIEAAGRAVATAGSAVVFAGVTVMIALCGLAVCQIPFLTAMGVSAAGMVAIAVLVALTAIPAFLGLLGKRFAPKKASVTSPAHSRLGAGWIGLIMRKPALFAVLVIAVLGAGAVPLAGLSLSLVDNGYERPGTQMRETYDEISRAFGEGYNSPIIVIADIVQSTDPLGLVNNLSKDLASIDGVEKVALGTPNGDASLAFIELIPATGQANPATMRIVHEIRANAPTLEHRYGISNVMVTGITAVAVDIASVLNSALLPFGIVVVGLSIVLLMLVFRSIAVPITATIGYILSLGSGLGAVGAIFGWGWLADFFNVTKVGSVISFLPVIVMGILFGLAMDYEVFLVSRMREVWIHTGNAQRAVREGFIGSAKVVSAAALIMTSVFAFFIPDGNKYIKPIAVALTVGIFADAFLVRMTFIPAVMALLGKHAWWLPAWLDRRLPVVDVEGEGLARALEHSDWVANHGEAAVRLSDVAVHDAHELAFSHLSLVVRPHQFAVVRLQTALARSALAALLSGRIHANDGIAVISGHTMPDGISAIQASSYLLRTPDTTLIPPATKLVLCVDPGPQDWEFLLRAHSRRLTVLAIVAPELELPTSVRAIAIDGEAQAQSIAAIVDVPETASTLPTQQSHSTGHRIRRAVAAHTPSFHAPAPRERSDK
ncbi:MAG: MMPL family transporter [Arcanobacterium sp.]|nr:MMPL family transporter [Arcanobacterium sp.]